MTTPTASRSATFLRAHRAPVIALASALLVAGLFMAYSAYAHVERDARVQEVSRWSEEAAFTYAVPVTRNFTVWPEGTQLPMGQPGYFRTVSQFIDVNFTWRVAQPADAAGVAHADLKVVVRALAKDGREFWSLSRPLATGTFPAPTAGVDLGGRIDLDDLISDVRATVQRLPPHGGEVRWAVAADVKYAGQANGERVSNASHFEMPLRVDDPLIQLPAPDEIAWQPLHARTQTTIVERNAGWPAVAASLPALLSTIVGAGLLGATLWAWRTDPLRHLSPEEAVVYLEQERYAEWITVPRDRVPEPPAGTPVVALANFEDLVNTAMDARSRILLDPMRRVYFLFTPQVVYRYDPAAPPPRAAPPPTPEGLPRLSVPVEELRARTRRTPPTP